MADWLDNDNGAASSDRLINAIDRFRGNFIVEGAARLDENNWTSIRFGRTLQFRTIGQCTRCQMICIDQSSGEKTTEPLRTISHEFNGKIKFGIYLMGPPQMSEETDTMYVNCAEDVFVE